MEEISLSISLSTRMVGLAMFKSNTLLDYYLKLDKAKWSPEKKDSILASLASCKAHYTITAIIVSMPDMHCQTIEFNELLVAIESFATGLNIPIYTYPVKDIYRTFGSPIKRTRNSLMKRLVIFYPELEKYYDKELMNKNKFYGKLFEAVGVGAYHWLKSQE